MAAACRSEPSGSALPQAGAPHLRVLWLVTVAAGPWGTAAGAEEMPKCEDLRVGQYICKEPKINNATQEPVNCTNFTAHGMVAHVIVPGLAGHRHGEVGGHLQSYAIKCFPAPNISCKDFSGNETHFTGREVGFFKPISCRNVNGYSYRVAVALSLFLGWLGADRFYLGYPALGLLKFCTVGFCGIGSLIDFVLISMQIVGPSDGSSYIIDYYGTRLIRLSITNETFRKTQLYP
ncbi:TM2 domain-containing protein 1 isoform X1 [Nannospalax galili]|uniref:TM2 domain-containing protein 1 isoform X1 n=1 Tax=Nannospalax galili TaxID=1026970 RepID=UPI00111BF1B1|nr:TM2 domain-containing protein 1 isoform X1 [Nannospalax galili]